MALGLIKTTESVELVCKSDPAIGKETDEWVEVDKAKGARKKGATIVTVRALNDREILRCSTAFQAIDFESKDTQSTVQLADAMEKIVSVAFIRCAENGDATEDVHIVLHSIKTGPLISLGSWILASSGVGSDPT